jgi:hypothetical protein
MIRVGVTAFLLAAAFSTTGVGIAQSPPPLREDPDSSVGYPSVAAALAALKSRPDLSSFLDNGWTIIVDKKTRTIWSFSPSRDPSHPTVVKRQVVSAGNGSELKMTVLCESSKTACDNVVRQFVDLNSKALGR